MRSDIQAKIEELIKLTRMTKSWQDNVSKVTKQVSKFNKKILIKRGDFYYKNDVSR